MDLHMGSHSLPLKFMPCMHHQCPRLFTSSKGPICLLLPFWILPSMACYWGVNGSFATFSFPSHFDQKRKERVASMPSVYFVFYCMSVGIAYRDFQQLATQRFGQLLWQKFIWYLHVWLELRWPEVLYILSYNNCPNY